MPQSTNSSISDVYTNNTAIIDASVIKDNYVAKKSLIQTYQNRLHGTPYLIAFDILFRELLKYEHYGASIADDSGAIKS